VATAKHLKAEGQDSVLAHESAEWRQEALALLFEFTRTATEFHADDFKAYCDRNGLREPHHRNVWGSLYSAAARKRWIEKTGRYAASQTPESHAHHYVIWRSLINPGMPQSEKLTRFYSSKKGVGIYVKSSNRHKAAWREWFAEQLGVSPGTLVQTTDV